ncbi:pilus assembly protein TadG-related protein [Bacillus sp. FJAT-18017]|uniref:pilus assembly protein TadG-related protein n=1 Tax=Bacillus sp. FJAT-18017 TaxID=1705566 RepID=UPI000A85393D|nr:Tad domain-containing protein [Bacillus sp. FJAT-18017]
MRKFIKGEKGNAAVLTALILLGLLGVTGLAVDGGMLYMHKSKLQKVANAAALSGAQELTASEEKVKRIVNDILVSHNETGSLEGVTVIKDQKVSVVLNKKTKTSFAGLFGFDIVDVKAAASASIKPMGRAVGAAPLGIDESIPLEYKKIYHLKIEPDSTVSGSFGVLALEGPGANIYENNLRNGFQQEIKQGDIFNTQTGNIAGKTISVVKDLVNGCSIPVDDLRNQKCSRVLLIPVYQPYQFDSNQLKQVKVTGFAYFYITEPMSSNDTSITGMFIKRTGKGFTGEGSPDKGAYSIRLTE